MGTDTVQTTYSRTTYTVAEVAKLLKVSRWQVQRMIHRGELGHLRVGRYLRVTQAQLDSFLEGGQDKETA